MWPQRLEFSGPDHFDRPCEETEPCSCRIERIGIGFFVFEGVFEAEDLNIVHSIETLADVVRVATKKSIYGKGDETILGDYSKERWTTYIRIHRRLRQLGSVT